MTSTVETTDAADPSGPGHRDDDPGRGTGRRRARTRGRPGRRPVYTGWKIALSGATILALHSALILQAFGAYAVILQERFGWSKTTISVAYSFNRAESGLLGPVHGWALQRFGSKRVMRLGAVFLLLGFVWFSQISSPLWFVVSFFVIAIGAGLSGFLTVTTETVRWFERKRARALSLTSVGLAIGGLAAPLVVLSLTALGWRETALATGVLLAAVAWIASSLYGSSPAERGEPLDGEPAPPEPAAGQPRPPAARAHLTANQALRTSAFWFLSFGHAAALLVVGSVIAHLSLYLTEEQGFTLQGASFVMGAIPIAQITGMVAGGTLGDRLNKRWLCAGAMWGHVIGLLALTFATDRWMIWAFVVLHGVAWGMRGPLMAAIRADYFGSTSFGQIMGYSSLILMLGMVGGPLFAGLLADVTGSYRTGFTVLACLAASGSALFALSRPPDAPATSEDAEEVGDADDAGNPDDSSAAAVEQGYGRR